MIFAQNHIHNETFLSQYPLMIKTHFELRKVWIWMLPLLVFKLCCFSVIFLFLIVWGHWYKAFIYFLFVVFSLKNFFFDVVILFRCFLLFNNIFCYLLRKIKNKKLQFRVSLLSIQSCQMARTKSKTSIHQWLNILGSIPILVLGLT